MTLKISTRIDLALISQDTWNWLLLSCKKKIKIANLASFEKAHLKIGWKVCNCVEEVN